MHKSQVFGLLLGAFLAGIALASIFPVSEEQLWIFVGIGTGVLGLSAYRRTFGVGPAAVRRRKVGFLVGCLILAAVTGMWRMSAVQARHSVLAEFADRQAGGQDLRFTLRGFIQRDIQQSGERGSFFFAARELIVPQRRIFVREQVLVLANGTSRYNIGDSLTLTGALRTPERLGNPGVRIMVWFPEIVPDAPGVSRSPGERLFLGISRALGEVRDGFLASLERAVPEPAASYLGGILVGTRERIPDTLREAFNRTGTTHILALSGYNIAIIAEGMLLALVFFFKRRQAFWATVLGIVLFIFLTGASASVVRAGIMGILLLAASSFGRLYDGRNALILAAAVMVAVNPFLLVFDAGFQLSFLAVMGILYCYPLISRRFAPNARWGGARTVILMTLAAQVLVLPLLVFYFKTVSLVSLAANVLILPFLPAVMLAGFLAGLGGLVFAPLGALIGVFAWALATYQLKVVSFLGSLPFASVTVQADLFVIAGIYLVMGVAWLRLIKHYAR